MDKRLKELPRSDDEFWEDADIEITNIKTKKCEHYLVKKTNRAECKHCGAGFFIRLSEEVKDGQIVV